MKDPIRVVRAEGATLAVDAIINAVDPSMSGGARAFVEWALHAGAGPRLAGARAFLAPCPVGRWPGPEGALSAEVDRVSRRSLVLDGD